MEEKQNEVQPEYQRASETTDSYKKRLNWDMAIGLNKVDGLTPSKYLIGRQMITLITS